MKDSLTLDEIKRIVFTTGIRRSLAITEPPEDLPGHMAHKIWESVRCYAACGTWDGDPDAYKRITGEDR